MEIHPGKGVLKEEKFPNTRKHSHQWVCEEFWNIRGQQTREEKKKPTDYAPTTTPSGETVQTLASTTSKRGLDREVQAALLRERTRPKCPEDNLRELM